MMRNQRSRRWLYGVLAALGLVLALAGGYAYWQGRQADTAEQTVTVQLGDVEKTVTALGSLQPKDYVDVGAQVSGQLRRVHVDVGDVVKKGQLLAEIDPDVYRARVEGDRASLRDLEAQLARQQAVLRLATQTAGRTRALAEIGAASHETLEQDAAALDEARASLASIRAQIDKARSTLSGDEANLGYTRIYAPMDGTVVSLALLQGQTINANQQAPTILRIAHLDVMTVHAQVAEADVPRIRPGMPVYFTTLGDARRKLQATVRQVLPTPEKVNDVVLYTVLADVDNRDRSLMTDMTAQTFFVLDAARRLPVVPLAALRPVGEDGRHYLARVRTANGVIRRPVTVRLASRTQAAIESGLKAGDVVVLPGATGATGRDRAPSRRAGAGSGGMLPPGGRP